MQGVSRAGRALVVILLSTSPVLAAATAGAAPAPDPVVLQGTVIGADGRPAARIVQVYGPAGVVVGNAVSGPDGRFVVRARPQGSTARFAARENGYVTLRAETASTALRRPVALQRRWLAGRWTGADRVVTLRDEDPLVAGHQADDDSPLPSGVQAKCRPDKDKGDLTYPKKWTKIGQMNLNRGVTGTFSYGRESVNEVTFSINAGFAGAAVGGGTISSKRKGVVQTVKKSKPGRYQVYALVRYERMITRYDAGPNKGKRCNPDVVEMRPVKVYEKGLRSNDRGVDPANAAKGDCRNRRAFPTGFWGAQEPNSGFAMTESKSQVNRLGASVKGIGFDTQSGYSSNVSVQFEYGKKKRKYLACGIGGKPAAGGEPEYSGWTTVWAGY